jgi:hypothetical protein
MKKLKQLQLRRETLARLGAFGDTPWGVVGGAATLPLTHCAVSGCELTCLRCPTGLACTH